MDLFSLAARLTLDSSQYEKGVRGATAEGKSLANRLSTTLTKATKVVSVAAGAAFTAASATIVKVGKEAFSEYANLEQSLGGSEAVFQEYAGVVQESSKTAFKQAGMSMDEYLSYANKIGSLLQGSGFSEGEAADQAMQVMQRAADVASIMGVDVTTAMDAITGAAKGNFTMMDNLGVAMNATTLEAYALSKGITTSYSDMSQAQKVGLAYQKFLEDTQQYAGNYEKENTTLAGSVTSLQAAWKNFLSGSGSAEDVGEMLDLVFDAYSNAAETLMPHITEGMGTLISMISDRLPELIAKVMPVIVTTATNMLKALPHILWGAAVGVANGIIEAINQTFGTNFPKIEKVEMPTWADISEAATGVLNGIIDGINGFFGLNLPHISGIKIPTWTEIKETASQIIQGIIDGINGILNPENGSPVTVNFGGIVGALNWVYNTISTVLGAFGNLFGYISTGLTESDSEPIKAVGGVLRGISNTLKWIQENSGVVGQALTDIFVAVAGSAAFIQIQNAIANFQKIKAAALGSKLVAGIKTAGSKLMSTAMGPFALLAGVVEGTKLAQAKTNQDWQQRVDKGRDDFHKAVTDMGEDAEKYSQIIDTVNGIHQEQSLKPTDNLFSWLTVGNTTFDNTNVLPVLNAFADLLDKDPSALEGALSNDTISRLKQWNDEGRAYDYTVGETADGIMKDMQSLMVEVSNDSATAIQAADALNNALLALPDEIRIPISLDFTGAGTDGSHAKGLNYVPYDGYIAELHRGEQVVMAGNANRDGGMDIGAMASAIAGAVAAALSNLTVQMDGETVGNMVTDYVADNVSTAARGKRFAL